MALDPDIDMGKPEFLDPSSPLFYEVFDTKSINQELMKNVSNIEYKPGRGNAITGQRKAYNLIISSIKCNQ